MPKGQNQYTEREQKRKCLYCAKNITKNHKHVANGMHYRCSEKHKKAQNDLNGYEVK
jgi:hypothetical protein